MPSEPREMYERLPVATPPIPILDYYPRAFQLASTGTDAALIKNIFVANDVIPEPEQSHPPMPSNLAGSSWVAKARYFLSTWQLWGGPFGGPDPNHYERIWGGAVLLHSRDIMVPTGGKNRVLLFGGSYRLGSPAVPYLWTKVEEFIATSDPKDGTWITKTHCMKTGRYQHNTVVLPTGLVLLIGGGCEFDANNREIPSLCPELYDPGDISASTGATSWKMARSGLDPQTQEPYPRLYHSVAVLLADGRVFIAGGLDYSAYDASYANSQFTGEIFAPPYVNHPDRPSIVSVTPPTNLAFDSLFDVTVNHTGGHNPLKPIDAFVLLRPAAVTHHFDNDQRYIELEIVQTGSVQPNGDQSFQVRMPKDDLGPPGYYLLWAVRKTLDAAPNDRVPTLGGYMLRLS